MGEPSGRPEDHARDGRGVDGLGESDGGGQHGERGRAEQAQQGEGASRREKVEIGADP